MIFSDNSTRGQKDLVKAYNVAKHMVTKLGMSEIGMYSLPDDNYKAYSD